jgi:molecular chaperone GrpE (heat shock protein)
LKNYSWTTLETELSVKTEIFFYCRTLVNSMPEYKIRISARISKELYDICLQRYDNITNAINIGLELLRAQGEDEKKNNEDNSQLNEDIRRHGEDKSHTSEDMSGEGEILELKARVEEKERHIESLKSELDNLRSVHNNYMLQMQTLINQKAIEAPGAKKLWWRFW